LCVKHYLSNITTTALIRRADVLALEDLNVKGMMKNHCLAGAVAGLAA